MIKLSTISTLAAALIISNASAQPDPDQRGGVRGSRGPQELQRGDQGTKLSGNIRSEGRKGPREDAQRPRSGFRAPQSRHQGGPKVSPPSRGPQGFDFRGPGGPGHRGPGSQQFSPPAPNSQRGGPGFRGPQGGQGFRPEMRERMNRLRAEMMERIQERMEQFQSSGQGKGWRPDYRGNPPGNISPQQGNRGPQAGKQSPPANPRQEGRTPQSRESSVEKRRDGNRPTPQANSLGNPEQQMRELQERQEDQRRQLGERQEQERRHLAEQLEGHQPEAQRGGSKRGPRTEPQRDGERREAQRPEGNRPDARE